MFWKSKRVVQARRLGILYGFLYDINGRFEELFYR
jgi:hypothetical protein